MKLHHQRYGKQRVRVLRRIVHANGQVDIIEVQTSLLLEGDFASAYFTHSNESIVPTDTVKNTVHALAKNHLVEPIEQFALTLSRHFLEKYAHVERVLIELESKPWRRLRQSSGEIHPAVFLSGADLGVPFTHTVATREGFEISSGVKDLLVFKATGSSFHGYPKCDFTTLPETSDRILASNMHATWTFSGNALATFDSAKDLDFMDVRTTTLTTLLDVFAKEFSHSVQNTLMLMGTAALKESPLLTQIRLAMPNKHYLPIDLSPFGLKNDNDVFLPTDEPHGQIEATITRED